MSRFERILAEIYNFEYFPLMLGMLGQTGLASKLLQPYIPAWIAVIPLIAWLPVWFFAHLNGIPILLQSRLCWAVGVWWAAITIGLELLILLGYIGPFETRTVCRVLMHSGWLYFIPTIHRSVLIRRHMKALNLAANPENNELRHG